MKKKRNLVKVHWVFLLCRPWFIKLTPERWPLDLCPLWITHWIKLWIWSILQVVRPTSTICECNTTIMKQLSVCVCVYLHDRRAFSHVQLSMWFRSNTKLLTMQCVTSTCTQSMRWLKKADCLYVCLSLTGPLILIDKSIDVRTHYSGS